MSARSAINKHGVTVTFRAISAGGTYDPATGSLSGKTTQDYSIKVYPYNYDLLEIDGTSILKGDRKVLMYPQSGVPAPLVDDQIVGLEDIVSVVSVRKIYSGGSVVAYILQVRE